MRIMGDKLFLREQSKNFLFFWTKGKVDHKKHQLTAKRFSITGTRTRVARVTVWNATMPDLLSLIRINNFNCGCATLIGRICCSIWRQREWNFYAWGLLLLFWIAIRDQRRRWQRLCQVLTKWRSDDDNSWRCCPFSFMHHRKTRQLTIISTIIMSAPLPPALASSPLPHRRSSPTWPFSSTPWPRRTGKLW